jgi:biofilm PGA synthesis lipoprotein PgaB
VYEDREQYRSRIGADLSRSQRAFREELGTPTRVLVWPYGAHNEMARAQAQIAGFEVTLALEHRLVTAEDLRSGCLPRFLFHRELDIEHNPDWCHDPAPPMRMATVPLDGMWKAGEPAMRRALDEAVARVRAVGANAVLIPVFAAPDHDGRLSTSFAMNHQAQIAADVWAFAADRFRQEEFRVWALVPTLNLTWAWDRDPTLRVPVRAWPGTHGRWSTKLSPDLEASRRAAVDLVTDLAVYLQMDGMVFDDDGLLAPSERLATNGSKDPLEKAAAVRGLVDDCKRAVLAWRPECRFGRIVPQEVVEQPGTSATYAMSLEDLFAHDEVALAPLVAPGRGSSAQEVSLNTEKLARRAASRWYRLRREGEVPVVFLIPARDPRDGRAVPSEFQVAMARALNRVGLYHRGSLAPMAAGELPLGLLDAHDPVPVQQASRRH